MRTDLSEEAEATIGRLGCGVVCQARVVEAGVRVARGVRANGRKGLAATVLVVDSVILAVCVIDIMRVMWRACIVA